MTAELTVLWTCGLLTELDCMYLLPGHSLPYSEQVCCIAYSSSRFQMLLHMCHGDIQWHKNLCVVCLQYKTCSVRECCRIPEAPPLPPQIPTVNCLAGRLLFPFSPLAPASFPTTVVNLGSPTLPLSAQTPALTYLAGGPLLPPLPHPPRPCHPSVITLT